MTENDAPPDETGAMPLARPVGAASILEYRTPTPPDRSRRIEVPPGVLPVVGGLAVMLMSFATGRHTVPLLLTVPFGVGVAVASCYIGHVGRRRTMSLIWRLQLAAAVLLVTVALMAIGARAGSSDSSARGFEYWSTYNPGYRYNPRWALRPLPWAAAGVVWFVAVVAIHRVARRGSSGPPPASSE